MNCKYDAMRIRKEQQMRRMELHDRINAWLMTIVIFAVIGMILVKLLTSTAQ